MVSLAAMLDGPTACQGRLRGLASTSVLPRRRTNRNPDADRRAGILLTPVQFVIVILASLPEVLNVRAPDQKGMRSMLPVPLIA